jgi:hypothetical protein
LRLCGDLTITRQVREPFVAVFGPDEHERQQHDAEQYPKHAVEVAFVGGRHGSSSLMRVAPKGSSHQASAAATRRHVAHVEVVVRREIGRATAASRRL